MAIDAVLQCSSCAIGQLQDGGATVLKFDHTLVEGILAEAAYNGCFAE